MYNNYYFIQFSAKIYCIIYEEDIRLIINCNDVLRDNLRAGVRGRHKRAGKKKNKWNRKKRRLLKKK